MLEQLPHDKVEPDQLKEYVDSGKGSLHKIVISQFAAKDLVRNKDKSRAFTKSEYYKNPQFFESKFHEYLPYVHFLVNGIYWEARYPRVLTINELREAVVKGTSKLLGVCDISADYEGSVQFTNRFTTIEEPFLVYDPIKG